MTPVVVVEVVGVGVEVRGEVAGVVEVRGEGAGAILELLQAVICIRPWLPFGGAFSVAPSLPSNLEIGRLLPLSGITSLVF